MVTPQVVVEALELDDHRSNDDRTITDLIRVYTMEADLTQWVRRYVGQESPSG